MLPPRSANCARLQLVQRPAVRPRTDSRASGRLRPASRAPAASLRDGLRPPLTRPSADLLCSAIGSAPPSVPTAVRDPSPPVCLRLTAGRVLPRAGPARGSPTRRCRSEGTSDSFDLGRGSRPSKPTATATEGPHPQNPAGGPFVFPGLRSALRDLAWVVSAGRAASRRRRTRRFRDRDSQRTGDGRLDVLASGRGSVLGVMRDAALSQVPVPRLVGIATGPQFVVEIVERSDFDRVWLRARGGAPTASSRPS